ncbi:MAG TPA: hypothetical protein VEY30_08450, partial [Myxococcaceae bacterium]|nr:hypothetical protein [Myxococcaceae bacterium]
EADARLTVASMAAGAKQVAELVLFAAHPTLAPHREDALDPDYPGRMSAAREQGHGGVSLFLPASVGNASGRLPEAEASNHPGLYAAALAAAVARTPVVPVDGPVALGASRVEWTLPDPDASRLSPPWTGRAADNALCALTPARTEVAALRLGPLRWLAVPLEPTYGAAQVLEHAAGASRVVALEGDYLSYVETSDAVRGGNGEAARQYFEPSLLAALEEAASRALRELEPTQTPTR